jgi:hypothetical protein
MARENDLAYSDTKTLFIYDRTGNLIGSYSGKDIFNVTTQFWGISLSIDNQRNQLQIDSRDSKIKKIIDLGSGKLTN